MSLNIRYATTEDARSIVETEKEIALEPGYLCSQPFELSEKRVRETIESLQSIYLVAEKGGQILGHALLATLPLQSLSHVAQLNLVVNKVYQGQGIGRLLLEKLIDLAKQSPSIEKIELNVRASNSQAIALYKRFGFLEEGCLKKRIRIAGHYWDDILMALPIKGNVPRRNISRIGVYGVARKGSEILVVVQKEGSYEGRYDLPGGGMEFGETALQTLHREFVEEVNMDFESMEQLANLTALVEVPCKGNYLPYKFHQIGLIYLVTGLRPVEADQKELLEHRWVEISTLQEEVASPFLWKIINS